MPNAHVILENMLYLGTSIKMTFRLIVALLLPIGKALYELVPVVNSCCNTLSSFQVFLLSGFKKPPSLSYTYHVGTRLICEDPTTPYRCFTDADGNIRTCDVECSAGCTGPSSRECNVSFVHITNYLCKVKAWSIRNLSLK